MKTIQGILIIVLMLIAIIGGAIFYAFKIEPYRIVLETFDLNEEKNTGQLLKIVQLTDIHIKEDFQSDNLEKIIVLVNEQDPDIVLFTGDLYDNYGKYHEDTGLVEQLKNIKARYAKIAIWGNRDHGGGAARNYEDIMEDAGFSVLMNENKLVSVDETRTILFTGLDDSLLGAPEMPDTSEFEQANYKILLTHEPDTIEPYRDADYDIALSGHSHGGQVNIPFIPFLNEQATETTNLASIYARGMYDLSEGNIKKIFVNTGIGTTHISARFGVPPKVTLFKIYLD